MSIPAAWHPDPTGRHEHRYWDGTAWTEHVADAGQVGRDPLASPGPSTASESSGGGAEDTSVSAGRDDGAPTASAVDPEAAQPASEQHPVQQEPTLPAQPASEQRVVEPEPTSRPPGPTATPGRPAAGPAQQPAAEGGPSNGLALAALIVGLVSLGIAWIPFVGLLGVMGGLVALLLGTFGRGRARRIANGAGLALGGIITGVLAILLGIATTVLPLLFFQGMVGDFEAVDACIERTGDEDACIEEHAPWWVRLLEDADELDQLEELEN
jgi:hypothetical protein